MGEEFVVRALNAGNVSAAKGAEMRAVPMVGRANAMPVGKPAAQNSSEDELVAFTSETENKKPVIMKPRVVVEGAQKTTMQAVNPDAVKLVSSTKETESTKEADTPQEAGTIDNPRIVQETSEEVEQQQQVIKNLVDSLVLNSDFGKKGLEVVDNVIYQDQNGNPTRQVITKKNSDGDTVTIQVEYDNQGRITKVSSQLDSVDKEGHAYRDGDQFEFEYRGDGTIKVTPKDAYTLDDGTTANWLTQKASYIIDRDGKLYMIDVMGKKSEIPFILPF